MEETQKSPKSMTGHAFTQFDLTTRIVKNLKQFNLTPTAKLVLLELSTHYNEEKNGAVVFPSMPYIAECLGIGLTATKQAIKDLINEGLVIKSKRDKINGNYNKYILTLKVQNTTSQPSENELLKQSDSDLSMIRTNNHEKIKQQTQNVVSLNPVFSNDFVPKTAQNSREFDEILLKHVRTLKGIKNDNAYMNWLKKTGQAKQIVNDILEGERQSRAMKRKIEKLSEQSKIDFENASEEIPQIWKDLKKRLQ